MPRSFTSKDERQYEHIKDSATRSGRSAKTAKRIAAATVNKRRSAEGRTEEQKERRGATRTARKSGGSSRGTRRAPTKRTSDRRAATKRSPTKRQATKRGNGGRRVGPALRPSQGGDRRTLVQLRKRASQLEIAGRGRMNKAQLIAAIDRR